MTGLKDILDQYRLRDVDPQELVAMGILPVVVIGTIDQGNEKAQMLSEAYIPVAEKKNTWVWEKVYEENNIDADRPAGTKIFNGKISGKYICLDDCDMWGYVVKQQAGGAGVAKVDVHYVGSFDATNWGSSSAIRSGVKDALDIVRPGSGAVYNFYFCRYNSINVKVNTQGADLYTVQLWRRRKQ
ncbi:MAG: hypothetical protein DRI93_04420 [Aquificota bacterium]|nr:MAG: hypothetical protein DRI93_04420 [Aquificota bacterium]